MSTPNPTTTPWVPLWDLNGGITLTYYGDWVAGTYKDGDIVVYNGVAYVCVRPTSSPPAAWPIGAALATAYGTTLPASPANGQEAILVDSLTNPTYQWRFRYNVYSSSTYKWEFIGGSERTVNINTQETTTTYNTWVDLATIGPSFVVPRAGDYIVRGVSAVSHSASPASNYIGISYGATDAQTWQSAGIWGANNWSSVSITAFRLNSVSSGQELRMRYYQTQVGTAYWSLRNLSVIPVRVS